MTPPIPFPIESHFTTSDENFREATKASKDVIMPRWLWIALPFAMIGNPLLSMISHTDKDRVGQTTLTVLGALGIYGLFYFFAVRKKKKARAALIGSKIDGIFRDDTLDFSINGNTSDHQLQRNNEDWKGR